MVAQQQASSSVRWARLLRRPQGYCRHRTRLHLPCADAIAAEKLNCGGSPFVPALASMRTGFHAVLAAADVALPPQTSAMIP